MQELNVEFMDLYKSVDRFIRDSYSSTEGVSEYIRRMELKKVTGEQYVQSWKDDYYKLKHLRWIRNQLAHEVGYDAEICAYEDFRWLREFYARLNSSSDPLAVVSAAEKAILQRRRELQQWSQTQRSSQTQAQTKTKKLTYTYLPKKKKSFWQRVKDFFSGKD